MSTTTPTTPPRPNRFVLRIDDLINRSEKTQRQISYEIGYDKPNIITMFKQGTTRVPLEKVPALALSIDADATELVLLWLEVYEPGMRSILEEVAALPRTDAERDWVGGLREVFRGEVPAFGKQARALVGLLMPGGPEVVLRSPDTSADRP